MCIRDSLHAEALKGTAQAVGKLAIGIEVELRAEDRLSFEALTFHREKRR